MQSYMRPVTGFSLGTMCSRLIHVVILHSSLWPNDIPLYEHTAFCLFICQLIDNWVVSPLGHSDEAAMNICNQFCVDVWFPSSWVYTPRMAGSCVTLHLTFQETAQLFFKAAAPLSIPASNVGGVPFLPILASTCYFLISAILVGEAVTHVCRSAS